MAPKPRQILAEFREARQILAELGALMDGAAQPDTSTRKETMMITSTSTVRELAVEIPHAARVFEKLGIDYCCGGHKPLQEACATANVSLDRVLLALQQGVDTTAPDHARDWSTAPVGELIDHIVTKHHAYVKSEIPRLQALIAKVVGVHGYNHPELADVQSLFAELADELAAHLMKEEQVLFPYMKQMASSGKPGTSCFGTVQNPIRMMMFEHDNAGGKLREMRQATNDYALPADACFSYGTLFGALADFEQDLHQHIHLENNILFPRAVALEQ
jgi:regulator of cell morphogenesis and NO signaling